MKRRESMSFWLAIVLVLGACLIAKGAIAASFSPNTWVKMNATGDGPQTDYPAGLPGGRAWLRVSYDSTLQKIVLFGGSSSTYMSDLWTYSLSENVWRIQRPHPDLTGPCRRDNHSLLYDPVRHVHWLLYGASYDDTQPGCSSGFNAALSREGQWTYDAATNNWTKITDGSGPLHKRLAPATTYDSVRQVFLEFGGQAVGANVNTTYTINPATHAVTQLNPAAAPPGRYNVQNAMVYDAAHDVFVLFGGRGTSGTVIGDTWMFNPSTQNWTQGTPAVSPPPRELHAMVYDSVNQAVILHGGRDANGGALNDTWVYDVGQNRWTQLSTGGTPPALFHHSAVYDPVNRVMIVVPGTQSNDTWVFAYQPGVAPPPTPSMAATPVPTTPAVNATQTPGLLPTNPSTPVGTVPPPATVPPGARINIPLKTFVVRQLPGFGKGPFGSIKHARITLNPLNGRLYVASGDWVGPCTGAQCNGVTPLGSYRNEQWSYGVASDTWVRETDYCQYPNPQPQRPDFNGWAWDSLRRVFWLHGGYQDIDNPNYCTQTAQTRNQLMWFDPATKLWAGPAGRTPLTSLSGVSIGLVTYAQYDAVNDTLMWLAYDGARSCMLRYKIATNTWTKTRFNTGDAAADDARLGEQFSAYDDVNRVIYTLEDQTANHPGIRRLYKVNLALIDSNPSAALTWESVPSNIRVFHDHERIAWDSVNNVILYPFHGGQGWDPRQFQMSVWHPGNPGTWEVVADPVNGVPVVTEPPDHCATPEAAACVAGGNPASAGQACCLVRGNQVAFDPLQNVLVLYGGSEPTSIYLYLFRYGNGSAPSKPSAPQLL
jgi:hypothetical protein